MVNGSSDWTGVDVIASTNLPYFWAVLYGPLASAKMFMKDSWPIVDGPAKLERGLI